MQFFLYSLLFGSHPGNKIKVESLFPRNIIYSYYDFLNFDHEGTSGFAKQDIKSILYKIIVKKTKKNQGAWIDKTRED